MRRGRSGFESPLRILEAALLEEQLDVGEEARLDFRAWLLLGLAVNVEVKLIGVYLLLKRLEGLEQCASLRDREGRFGFGWPTAKEKGEPVRRVLPG